MIPDNPDRNSCDRARAIAIQTDGKVLVAGSSDAPNGDSNFALVRYNLDGSMGNTFEDNSIFPGTVLTDFGYWEHHGGQRPRDPAQWSDRSRGNFRCQWQPRPCPRLV
jgi:hypothetical protein